MINTHWSLLRGSMFLIQEREKTLFGKSDFMQSVHTSEAFTILLKTHHIEKLTPCVILILRLT